MAIAGLLCIPACGGPETVRTIPETRTVAKPAKPVDPSMSTADRLGINIPGAVPGPAPAAADPGIPYAWTVPPDWTELAPTAFRMANLLVGGDPRAECTLTILPGGGGGIAANLNRWRGQMSLSALTPAEIEALPRREILGQEAVLIEAEGVYTGMSGTREDANYKLMGAALMDGGNGVFIKMTGPAELIDSERSAFLAFCDSLRHVDSQPHAAPAPGPAASAAPGTASQDAARLAWDAPDSWEEDPAERPLRTVTFRVGSGATECYVAELSGPAGGALANLNRWRQQMGLEPDLTSEALAELPVLEVLGRPARLIEMRGHYTGMGEADLSDAMLRGLVVELPDRTVFVKMVGPEAEVAPHEAAFAAFCTSLRTAS